MATKTIYSTEYRRLVDQLREKRVAMGLSQTALAKELGWAQQKLSAVEAGARRLDVMEFFSLTTALGMSHEQALAIVPKAKARRRRSSR